MANWRDKKPSGRERAQQRQQAASREPQEATASSKKADWRKKGAASRAEGAHDKPEWAKTDAAPADWRVYRSRFLKFAFGSVIFGLVCFVIYILIQRPESTPFVMVDLGDGDGSNSYSSIPNSNGVLPVFTRVEDKENDALKVRVSEGDGVLVQDNLDEFMQRLKIVGGGPDNDVCLIHLSASGVVDEQGKPYLIGLRGDPFDKTQWISVEAFLKRLVDLKDKNGNKLRTVVLMDSSKPEPIINPELMVDRFPSAVDALFADGTDLNKSNVFVILSHDTGQRSWFAPELGRSVFSHFLAKGFAGDADGFLSSGKRDNSITLKEISSYVRAHVDYWVAKNRGMSQTPSLLPIGGNRESDFGILLCKGFTEPEDFATPTLDNVRQRASGVEEKWDKFYGRLSTENLDLKYINRIRPFALARFESMMIRLESLAPDQGSNEFNELLNEVDELIEDIFDLRDLKFDRRTVSLAEAESRNEVPTARMLESVKEGDVEGDLLTRWVQAHALEDIAKRTEAVDGMRLNLTYANEQYTTREELRWLMWNWIKSIDGGPSQQQLAEAIAVLKEHLANNRSTENEWTEIKFLQLLHEYIDWESAPQAEISNAISVALNCRWASESTIVNLDPRSRYWLEQRYSVNEQRRREAEDMLYAGAFSEAAEVLAELPAEYDEIARLGSMMASTLDLHQEALRKIPYLAAWEFRRHSANLGRLYQANGDLSNDGKDEQRRFESRISQLRDLILAADELGRDIYLKLPAGSDSDIENIDTSDLRNGLRDAEGRYVEACRALVNDQPGKNESALIELYCALLCPLAGDSQQRESLRKQYLDTLAQYDGSEGSGEIEAVPNRTWQANLTKDYDTQVATFLFAEDRSAFNRAEQRLRSDLDQLISAIARPTWNNEATDFYSLFEQLESDWLVNEPDLNRQEQRNRLFGVDHNLRRVAPYLAASRARIKVSQPPRAVGEDLAIIERDLLELSLAERAVEDFWGDGPETSPPNFYFSRLAKIHLRAISTTEELRRNVESLLNERVELATLFKRQGYKWLMPQEDAVYDRAVSTFFRHQCEIKIDRPIPSGVLSAFVRRAKLDGIYTVQVANGREDERKFEVLSDGSGDISRTITYQVPVQQDFLPNERFSVCLNFRGHETSRIWEAEQPTGQLLVDDIRIPFTPVQPAEAEVNVIGGERATSDVVIIIDYSSSMKEMVDNPEVPDSQTPRYDVARQLVRKLLRRLRDEGTYRVAIYAYGHRVKYLGGEEDNVEWNAAYASAEQIEEWNADGVKPYKDVEKIFGFSESRDYAPTSPEEYIEMLDFFQTKKLVSWGQTPLFQSILDAEQHLTRLGNPKAKKQMIVITDGFNNLGIINNVTRGKELGDVAELDGDENLLSLKGGLGDIAIHMVLFGVSKAKEQTQEEFEKKKQQLRSIQTLSGVEGDVLDSSDSSVVFAQIDQFIVANRYTIKAPGLTDPNGETDLGEQWLAPIRRPGPHRLEVQNQGVSDLTLYLYGGEKLDISIRNDKTIGIDRFPKSQFTHSRSFSFGNAQYQIGLLDVESPETFEKFKIGFLDSRFESVHTNRPGFVMLDVSQNSPDPNDPFRYRLYDYEFRPGTSYPIVEFPSIPFDPASNYNVTLQAVPLGRTPKDFTLRKSIDEIPIESAAFEINSDGTLIRVYKRELDGLIDVVLEIKNEDDPERVRELIARCSTACPTKRQYNPDWERALYTFTLSPEALSRPGEEPVQLEIFKDSDLFYDANQSITHRFSFP